MEVFEFGSKTAPAVLIQPVGEHNVDSLEREVSLIREASGAEFRLLAFKVDDWNRDLSPWKAPAVFGKEDFGGRAAETLKEILPYCEDAAKAYYIGGYSLAALFALWAAHQSGAFCGVAAASPSLWFPGFDSFMEEQEIQSRRVYLSLGDREEKTRNPVMATVGDRVRAAYALLEERGVDCRLEWNPGNHFRDADLRTARAFAWVIRSIEEP